ncbi:phosphoribosyl-AMP cyclohydrolase [Phenylobacterium sp. Root77]|uniref:phosphoribosyl-AMP cyclohydrolase n=1 Tax=unclassified Phenylobacterium TaxID=2640670 RepID=UPI0006FF8F34|nr:MULTISPECIES: phosphoribosyl-AMP cyclohydrolase [unclassified Phenylobacterium]KQW73570.1 phosphoribosyl-AMP cyclohydrolase [Phenylobacterium sp. Root1277]KQW92806.1 phosphoribosyl-AMP cyclohydrolase [Phenylobacterium sp. Root1290]KRC41753.1 phosphoribosyl-AMP cyclohydrolase [Phenylobacterium sp. Root77]
MTQASFPTASSKDALERGEVLSPRFDANGLVAVVATHAQTGEVLMFAHMNAEALARTIELGEAVYFSRSRNEIWHKGATSGQIQQIVEMRIDCDQDCIWLKVLPQGDGGACHVGFRSCFYRVVEDGKLVERP